MPETKSAKEIETMLQQLADPERAASSQRFFKTAPGEYAEGDVFLGVRVPVLRAQVRALETTPLREIKILLSSKYHEVRLLGLFVLVRKFQRGDALVKADIFELYLKSTAGINNWDLVDSSAYQIVGAHLEDKNRDVLYQLVESKVIWERRIAMVATYWFIKNGDFSDTFKLAKILLDDEEDLIHKAVGWMLREAGNRNVEEEKRFLARHYKVMPRTMLRYAIEKFPPPERQRYLKGEV